MASVSHDPFVITMTPLRDIKPLGPSSSSNAVALPSSFFAPQPAHSLTPSNGHGHGNESDDEPDDEATTENDRPSSAPSAAVALPGTSQVSAGGHGRTPSSASSSSGTDSSNHETRAAISAALAAGIEGPADDVEVVEEGEAAKQAWWKKGVPLKGFLEKAKSGILKGWNKRYFMIHPLKAENATVATRTAASSGPTRGAPSRGGSPSSKDYWRYLNYYTNDKDFTFPKSIDLLNITAITPSSTDKRVFEIVAKERTFTLRAYSENSRDLWVDNMKTLLEYEVKRRQRADRKVTKESRDEAKNKLRTAKKKLDRKQAREAHSRQLVVKGTHSNAAATTPTEAAAPSSTKRTSPTSGGESKYGDEPEHKDRSFPPTPTVAAAATPVAATPAPAPAASNHVVATRAGETGSPMATPNLPSRRTAASSSTVIAPEDELLVIQGGGHLNGDGTGSGGARTRRPNAAKLAITGGAL